MDAGLRRLAALLSLGGLLVVVDTTVTLIVLPQLATEFDADLPAVQWTTTAYALALVAVMPLAAWVARRLGGRGAYLGALALFTLGSLLTGCAGNLPSMIAFRVLQGAGGGLLNPVGMAIALAAAPTDRRGRVMGVLGLPVLVGPVLGPVLGGLLVDHASWRWCFWLNVPLGVAALAAGRRVLPAGGRRRPAPLDVTGVALLCAGTTLAVLGLSLVGTPDATGGPAAVLRPAVLLLAGAALLAAFVGHTRRTAHPLLRLAVLRRPPMAAATGVLALFAAAYFGSGLLVPVYVQLVRGDGGVTTAWLGLPQALATGVALQVATRLVDRAPPRTVVGTGVAVAAVGTALRAAVLDASTPYPLLMALGAVTGAGVGATLMPTMVAATRRVPADDLPSATSLLNVVSQGGVAVGSAAIAATTGWLLGALTGGLSAAELARLPPADRAVHADAAALAVRLGQLVPVVLMVLAWLVSRRLTRLPPGTNVRRDRAEPVGRPVDRVLGDTGREFSRRGLRGRSTKP